MTAFDRDILEHDLMRLVRSDDLDIDTLAAVVEIVRFLRRLPCPIETPVRAAP